MTQAKLKLQNRRCPETGKRVDEWYDEGSIT